jgi:hypothetical protein
VDVRILVEKAGFTGPRDSDTAPSYVGTDKACDWVGGTEEPGSSSFAGRSLEDRSLLFHYVINRASAFIPLKVKHWESRAGLSLAATSAGTDLLHCLSGIAPGGGSKYFGG